MYIMPDASADCDPERAEDAAGADHGGEPKNCCVSLRLLKIAFCPMYAQTRPAHTLCAHLTQLATRPFGIPVVSV